jgi:predicted ABC-type ATPase
VPEAHSDVVYTVDIRRHETTFRANTSKGQEFLGGVDLTMSNEEAHTFIQDARAAGLTVKLFF